MSEATKRLDALQAQTPSTVIAGRLSFPEKCAAYYLLRRGFKKSLVALTFNLSPMSATRLARADAEAERYPDIAREYERLGHDAFGERYYTNDIEARLQRNIAEVPTEGDTTKRKFGPNPNAREGAGRYRILAINGREVEFTVYWRPAEGWSYRQDQEPGAYESPSIDKTAAKARNAALENYAVTRDAILDYFPE